MTRNSRELSQFASFIDVRDANQNIGIITSIVIEPGGVGIGSTVADYLSEVAARGAVDPLINFNESYLLNKVYIEGDINVDGGDTASITSAGSTFNKLNVAGLTTTQHLKVTGIATIGGDNGIGTVHIGELETSIPAIVDVPAGVTTLPAYPGTQLQYIGVGGGNYFVPDNTNNGGNSVSKSLVVINNYESSQNSDDYIALQVFGRTQFNGLNPEDLNNGIGTAFVVVPESFFHNKITSVQGIDVVNYSGYNGIDTVFTDPQLRVYNETYENNLYAGNRLAAIFTNGGLQVDKYGEVGLGFSVGERLQVGYKLLADENGTITTAGFDGKHEIRGNISIGGSEIRLGFGTDNHLYNGVNDAEIILENVKFATNILPVIENNISLGDGSGNGWPSIFAVDLIDVGLANTVNSDGLPSRGQIQCLQFEAIGVSTVGRLTVGGINTDNPTGVTDLIVESGKTSLQSLLADGDIQLTGITTIKGSLDVLTNDGGPFNGYANTSFQANNVDVYQQDETNSTDPEFFYPAMANAGISQTAAGAQLFVNPGFYLDAFGTSLYVGNNLYVIGTAINADPQNTDIRFDLLNYNVSNLQIGSQADFIDMGQNSAGSIATIRNSVTDVQTIQISNNFVQAGTGTTSIILDDVDTEFIGKVTVGGTEIYAGSNDFTIASSPVSGKLFESANDLIIGASNIGITSIRNNVTEVNFLRLAENVIQADDEATAITVGSAGTFVETSGDLIPAGKNILTGFGVSHITMVDGVKTIFYQDIEVGGNNIRSSDGTVNITLFDNQELTSVTGALRVEGDQIRAGTGDTNITMSGNQTTIFAGAIEIDGDEIRSSNGQTNIILDSDVLTEFTGDIRVGGAGTIQAPDGVIAITVENGSGNVAIGSDLTANSAFFNGLEARLNVQDVNIRDNLLTLGLIEDPTTEGTLIPPNVAAGNTGDVGFLMARYDIGLSTHKYAGIFYDQSAGRVAIRTDVEEDLSETGRDRSLLLNGLPSELEVKNLLVTLNNTIGVKTLFEPSSSDATVLTLGNVEIDGGTY